MVSLDPLFQRAARTGTFVARIRFAKEESPRDAYVSLSWCFTLNTSSTAKEDDNPEIVKRSQSQAAPKVGYLQRISPFQVIKLIS
jgi:hypothetical protein